MASVDANASSHRRPAPVAAPAPPEPPRRYLRAGCLLISWSPCEVTTVLGSCVSVTFFCAKLGLGGICHAILPCLRHGDTADHLPRSQRWKYVQFAVPELIDCFCPPGVHREHVAVKLFGGSHLISRPGRAPSGASVGASNVAYARELLAAAGLEVVAEDVGGDRGRKVIFNTATGDVRVKLLGHEVEPT